MKPGREQLRDWMVRRGFNQREAAAYLDLNEVHYSQILNGIRSIGVDNAVKIETRTGIPVESWALNELSKTAGGAVAPDRKRRIS